MAEQDDVSILDQEQLDDIKSVMKDDFPGFLNETFENMEGHLATLKAAISEEDLNKVHMSAHPLASNSAYLGAKTVRQYAKNIESMVNEERENEEVDFSVLATKYQKLKEAYDRAKAALLHSI